MHNSGHNFAEAIPVAFVVFLAVAYLALASLGRDKARHWSRWRTALFVSGCAALLLALRPDSLPYPQGDFRKHMLQHLLIGMLAPLGLVMGAPVTLALRALPATCGKRLGRLFHIPLVRLLANPFTALLLNFGAMAALYFTPLYHAMMVHAPLHYAVHAHFLLAGCLYTWVIAGPDPSPYRPSVPMRLAILGVAVVLHSALAQMLYAGILVAVQAPVPEIQHGAELMYYGGDITEMLLAFALVTTWHPARTRPGQQAPALSLAP